MGQGAAAAVPQGQQAGDNARAAAANAGAAVSNRERIFRPRTVRRKKMLVSVRLGPFMLGIFFTANCPMAKSPRAVSNRLTAPPVLPLPALEQL